jgi:hypothetical protein
MSGPAVAESPSDTYFVAAAAGALSANVATSISRIIYARLIMPALFPSL